MKVTIKAFVHKGIDQYVSGYCLFSCDDMTSCGYVLVGPVEIEYEVPESFNPVAAQVTALEKMLDEETHAHTRKVMQIKGRIQELLCIENNPTVQA